MFNASTTTPKGPVIDVVKFKTNPTAAWHDYKQKFVAFMASHKGYWTTVTDPDDRIDPRVQNPWTTSNTADGRAKRAEHAAVQGLCLRELTEFSTVPKAKESVAQFNASMYFDRDPSHTGEPFLPGTMLYAKLDHLFSPILQGEIDNAVEKMREILKEFPGLTRQDANNDGAALEGWINEVRERWSVIMIHHTVRDQEQGLFWTMRRSINKWSQSDANKKGLNLDYTKEIIEDPSIAAAADQTINKFLDVLINKLRDWLQDHEKDAGTGIKALATTTGGPCIFCGGPNHNVVDCNKLKAYKKSMDGEALARNHNPARLPGGPRPGPRGRGKPQKQVRFRASTPVPNFNRGGNYNSRGRGFGGYNGRDNRGRDGNNQRRVSLAPPGHPYKGKNFNPNYQKVTANTAGISAAAPPRFAAPPAAGGITYASGASYAADASSDLAPGTSNLSNILQANYPQISVNQVTVSASVAEDECVSISDDEKPSYCAIDIFGESDDDKTNHVTENNADEDHHGDTEINDADIEDNNEGTVDPDDTASMTSEQLDEAHDAFVATIQTVPSPTAAQNNNGATINDDNDSDDDSLPDLIRSSSSSSSASAPERSPSPCDAIIERPNKHTHGPLYSGMLTDITDPDKSQDGCAHWLIEDELSKSATESLLKPLYYIDTVDHFCTIVEHITRTQFIVDHLLMYHGHIPGYPTSNPIFSYGDWTIATKPEPKWLQVPDHDYMPVHRIMLFASYWDALATEQKNWFTERGTHPFPLDWDDLTSWAPMTENWQPPPAPLQLTDQAKGKEAQSSTLDDLDMQP